ARSKCRKGSRSPQRHCSGCCKSYIHSRQLAYAYKANFIPLPPCRQRCHPIPDRYPTHNTILLHPCCTSPHHQLRGSRSYCHPFIECVSTHRPKCARETHVLAHPAQLCSHHRAPICELPTCRRESILTSLAAVDIRVVSRSPCRGGSPDPSG